MPVGALRTIVVDCLDPASLAEFWSAVLDLDVAFAHADWVALHAAGPGHPRIAFQRVPESKVTKNRLHLDVWVEDIPSATSAAEALGATRVGALVTEAESPEPFQVMADPSGNEFCLVHLPGSTGP